MAAITQTRAGEQSISDNAVKAKTGKSWPQWFRILDRMNCGELGHAATVRKLRAEHDITHWWAQTVTVRYEQDRGLRAIGQREGGTFEVSVQRTISGLTLKKAYACWTDTAELRRWYGPRVSVEAVEDGIWQVGREKAVFRALKPGKLVRMTWATPRTIAGSTVEITFASASRGKVTVRVQHRNLPDADVHASMRKHWTSALERLKASVTA